MTPWRDPRVLGELDRITTDLRDRTAALERQLHAVERDVYRRNRNGDKQT